MRKLYATFIFTIFISALSAQTIYRTNLPYAGESYDGISITNAASWNPGTAGSAQTWDMSNATGDQVPFVYSSVDAGSAFSGSEQQLSLEGVGTIFFNSTGTTYDVTGMINSYGGENMSIPYSNPQTIFKFPLEFGDSFKDTANGMYTSTVNFGMGPMDATTNRTVYSETTVDGSGTLITPGASYSDVIRVKVYSVIKDTITADDFPGYELTQNSTTEEYYFFSSNFKHHVAYFMKVESSELGSPIELSFLINNPVISNTISGQNADLVSVFPNPANEFLNVKTNNKADFVLYNMSGESVFSASLEGGENKINVSELPEGLYHYRLNSGNSVKSGKVTLF